MGKAVLLIGAGATLSDAPHVALWKRPPLDKGFFRGAQAAKAEHFDPVREYMKTHYSVDPLNPRHDALEAVMATIYSDIYSPSSRVKGEATAAFRSLLRLLNQRLADTTNWMKPNPKGNVYRVIVKHLKAGYTPRGITILTFNQDLNIEKALAKLEGTPAWSSIKPLFNFPYCYRLPNYDLTKPPGGQAAFAAGDPNAQGIEVLKLHGSLNWFSTHVSKDPPPSALLNPARRLRITPRRAISTDMILRMKRKVYTFPVVVPPVVHKAAILHSALSGIWKRAMEVLSEADKVTIFGYSCPRADNESANLISRSLRQNKSLRYLTVIDPSAEAFARYAEVTGVGRIRWHRGAREYHRDAEV